MGQADFSSPKAKKLREAGKTSSEIAQELGEVGEGTPYSEANQVEPSSPPKKAATTKAKAPAKKS